MLHGDGRWINLVENVYVLPRILRLHQGHWSREQALLTIGEQVGVLGVPAWSGLKDHALKPHGLRCEVLYVDFQEDLGALLGR